MKSARLRLFLAACLFAGWIGWLIYLAVTTTTPIVLARPQFLAADLDVIAEVKEDEGRPDARVQVVEVLWIRKEIARPTVGEIKVEGLDRLKHENGWRGPGRYLLPLFYHEGQFNLARIGDSPGYPPSETKEQRQALAGETGPVRIYPATPETLHQEKNLRQGHWN